MLVILFFQITAHISGAKLNYFSSFQSIHFTACVFLFYRDESQVLVIIVTLEKFIFFLYPDKFD